MFLAAFSSLSCSVPQLRQTTGGEARAVPLSGRRREYVTYPVYQRHWSQVLLKIDVSGNITGLSLSESFRCKASN